MPPLLVCRDNFLSNRELSLFLCSPINPLLTSDLVFFIPRLWLREEMDTMPAVAGSLAIPIPHRNPLDFIVPNLLSYLYPQFYLLERYFEVILREEW